MGEYHGNHLIDEDNGSHPSSPLYDERVEEDLERDVYTVLEEYCMVDGSWKQIEKHRFNNVEVSMKNIKRHIPSEVEVIEVIENLCDSLKVTYSYMEDEFMSHLYIEN